MKKNYVLALLKRLLFIRECFILKTEKEKNEIEIEEYEIAEKIKLSVRQISQMEDAFTKEFNQFAVDLNDVTENYDSTIELAKKYQQDSFEIKHFLYAVNWKKIDESIEQKINFYKELKNILGLYLLEDE